MQIPQDADDFEPVVDQAKEAMAVRDNEEPKEQMDKDYVVELLIFISTGG